jgi:hypothetical protein
MPDDLTRGDGLARDRLVADAAALTRLAETPEWAVLERLTAEHLQRLETALRTRGLGPVETEGLRAEIEAVEWYRHRPAALRRAVEDLRAVEAQRAATAGSAEEFPDEIAG